MGNRPSKKSKQKGRTEEQEENESNPSNEPGPSGQETERQGHSPLQFRPRRSDSAEYEVIEEHPEERAAEAPAVQMKHPPTASEYAQLEQGDSLSNLVHSSQGGLDQADSGMSENVRSTENIARESISVRRRRWFRFKKYVYNNEEGTYCNRSFASWCAICNYYFWIIILFFAVFMIYILTFAWRDTKGSTVYLKTSLMPHASPALAIVPLDQAQSDMIIWYKSKGSAKNMRPQNYITEISTFLEKNDLACKRQKLVKQECHFELNDFGPCARADYGYNENKPCIFLKLNKLLTWMPTSIPVDHPLPSDISKDLVDEIRQNSSRHCVYVDCRGDTIFDQSRLGKVVYYPEAAFDIKYFPATRDTATNPLVAMKLNHIKVGFVVQIHCTLLAGNIKDTGNSNIKLTVYID